MSVRVCVRAGECAGARAGECTDERMGECAGARAVSIWARVDESAGAGAGE